MPAPLWPIMPTTSPCSMEKLTSSSALNNGRSWSFLPTRRAPVLSRVCLRPCRAPRRYSLVRWLTSMMGILVQPRRHKVRTKGNPVLRRPSIVDALMTAFFSVFVVQHLAVEFNDRHGWLTTTAQSKDGSEHSCCPCVSVMGWKACMVGIWKVGRGLKGSARNTCLDQLPAHISACWTSWRICCSSSGRDCCKVSRTISRFISK